jgi:hypothetical protein
MKVMLKQQVILPWEAPSQNIVLNVFNCELILLHLTNFACDFKTPCEARYIINYDPNHNVHIMH